LGEKEKGKQTDKKEDFMYSDNSNHNKITAQERAPPTRRWQQQIWVNPDTPM
jgi:hypothetical protein